MAPRTLSSTWKQYEKAIERYLAGNGSRTAAVAALNSLGEKANAARIAEALASMFVTPYPSMEEVTVRFLVTVDGAEYPEWPASYTEEVKALLLNPVGVSLFRQACEGAAEALKTPAARDGFASYRFRAYQAELAKLPMQLFIFLTVLDAVAKARRITHVERKGGEIEQSEHGEYLNLLWAFKELEAIYRTMSGLDLRAEFGILWYESDWIVGA